MHRSQRAFLLSITVLLGHATLASAYIGGPPLSLGHMCGWSTHVMIARIERLDRDKNIVIFRKVRDVKGKWPTEVMRHQFNPGLPNRAYVMDWAEPGKIVVMCALESYKWSHTYIDREWYASNTPDWTNWNVSHSEPLLLRMFAGRADRLVDAVGHVCAGREVVVPGMVDGPVDDLVKRKARFQRIKASLKLTDYNPKRDFVGWGNDDFSPLLGMSGFTQVAQLGKLGSGVDAIVSADFDGDGKVDVCLVGAHKVAVLLNGGDYFHEATLPGLTGGCRAAAAADYNADGKADLLVASVAGVRLYTSLGDGNFRDDTALAPFDGLASVSACAWIDYDADGWPDILLANGYHGLRLYRNKGKAAWDALATRPTPKPGEKSPLAACFEDVSDRVFLGAGGSGAGTKGSVLAVSHFDKSGFPGFLYGGEGAVFINAPHGFVPLFERGLSLPAGKSSVSCGDFDGDGIADLLSVETGGCKLYRGFPNARFVDVTAQAGDLAKPLAWATSTAWGDVDNNGQLDLVVGCIKGPNRFFRNKGDGTFEDATELLGLERKHFNTQAVGLADLNGDGALDMIFNNEWQESVVLLGNPERASKKTPLTVLVAGKEGVVGSRVRILDTAGRRLHSQEIGCTAGRNQPSPQARFALDPGTYRVEVRYSSGIVRALDATMAGNPVHRTVDERALKVTE